MTARSRAALFAALGLAAAVAGAGCGGDGDEQPKGPVKLTEAQVVAKARPSVVSLLGRIGDDYTGGTGVIVDPRRGLVLTNAHVVSGVSALKARIDERTLVRARVLAQAPCDDLAVVELVSPPAGLRALPFGDSDGVHNGQHVTALGYPASFDDPTKQKLVSTDGTVSAVGISAAPDPSLPEYPDLIQHQAPINPGNSGGPLVDDFARVIGINTLANTEQGGRAIQGQGYAISSKQVKTLLPDLEAGRSTGLVGWNIVPAAAVTGDPDLKGIYVLGVDSGSPAARGKMVSGDYFYEVEGTPVRSVAEVCDIVLSHRSGQLITVRGTYISGDDQGTNWRTKIRLR